MQWVDDEKDAELIGIIACSVRQKAIDKVYNKIAEWFTTKLPSGIGKKTSGI